MFIWLFRLIIEAIEQKLLRRILWTFQRAAARTVKQNIRKVRHFWNLGPSDRTTFDFLLKRTRYGQFARKFWQIGHNEFFSEESQEINQVVRAIWSKITKTNRNDCIFHIFANQKQSLMSWMDQNFINFSNLWSNLLPEEGFRPDSGFQRLEPPFFCPIIDDFQLTIAVLRFYEQQDVFRRKSYSPPSIRLFYVDFNLLDCGFTRKTRIRAGNP